MFEAESAFWRVHDARQIEAAFSCPQLAVRPTTALTLPFLVGTRAGMIFGNLARMTEGDEHRARRIICTSLIESMDAGRIATRTRRASSLLLESAETFADWQTGLSTCALGLEFGIDESDLLELPLLVGAFTRAISPGGSPEQIAQGITAADRLWVIVDALGVTDQSGSDRDLWTANIIGLFFQAYDSMAGLLGSTLIYLQGHPNVTDVRQAIRHVLREAPPIRNTRRFSIDPAHLGEVTIPAGETVLLDLEQAMRSDPGIPSLGFGRGVHQCPGQLLAFSIAAAALELGPRIRSGVEIEFPYHPLSNARIPDLRRFRIKDWQA